MVEWERLRHIAEEEFADIVESTKIIRDKLRVLLYDSSYLDFWWSTKIKGRFAHHWERTHIDRTIYRHDNMPHPEWKEISTFPQHFHNGSSKEAIKSILSSNPEKALREFLKFARDRIKQK